MALPGGQESIQATIKETYHELHNRVTLEYFDLIFKALSCDFGENIVRMLNKESENMEIEVPAEIEG